MGTWVFQALLNQLQLRGFQFYLIQRKEGPTFPLAQVSWDTSDTLSQRWQTFKKQLYVLLLITLIYCFFLNVQLAFKRFAYYPATPDVPATQPNSRQDLALTPRWDSDLNEKHRADRRSRIGHLTGMW